MTKLQRVVQMLEANPDLENSAVQERLQVCARIIGLARRTARLPPPHGHGYIDRHGKTVRRQNGEGAEEASHQDPAAES